MNTQMITQIGSNGLPPVITMSSREIADLTSKQHQHVKRDIEKMLTELGEDASNFGHIYFDSMNRKQTEYLLDRELTETLLLGYSAALRRRVLRRLRELEGMVYVPPRALVHEKVVAELAIVECYDRMLRPAPSSKVAMLQRVAKNNGIDSSFLPGYAIDAAPDATGGSSMPTKALSELLKEHGINYTARAYNLLLRDIGMLEERTRKTTDKNAPSGVKRFWSIAEAGLAYGKNITSPSSPRETQPHWYVERFADLHALVVKRMEGRQ